MLQDVYVCVRGGGGGLVGGRSKNTKINLDPSYKWRGLIRQICQTGLDF